MEVRPHSPGIFRASVSVCRVRSIAGHAGNEMTWWGLRIGPLISGLAGLFEGQLKARWNDNSKQDLTDSKYKWAAWDSEHTCNLNRPPKQTRQHDTCRQTQE